MHLWTKDLKVHVWRGGKSFIVNRNVDVWCLALSTSLTASREPSWKLKTWTVNFYQSHFCTNIFNTQIYQYLKYHLNGVIDCWEGGGGIIVLFES